MEIQDYTFQRHLACLASLLGNILAVDPFKLTGFQLIDKPASHLSTPTDTIPLKLVVSSVPPVGGPPLKTISVGDPH